MFQNSLGRWMATAGLVIVLLAISPAVPAAVIDDFDFPAPGEVFFLRGNNPDLLGTALVKQASPGILGLQRDVLIEVQGTPQIISAGGSVGNDLNHDVGLLKIATFGMPGSTVIVQYDGVDSGDTPELGLNDAMGLSWDLSAGGSNNGFLLRFQSVDGAVPEGLDLEITLTNSLAGSFGLTQTHYVPNSSVATDHFVAFAEFDVPYPELIFGDIDSITFAFNGDGTPNVDFELDTIETIPEPSTLVLLLLLGVAGLVLHKYGRPRPGQ